MGDRINRAIITQLGTLRCGDAWKNNKYKVARNIMTAGLFIYTNFSTNGITINLPTIFGVVLIK